MPDSLDTLHIYRHGSKVAIKGSTWAFKGLPRSVYQSQLDENPVKNLRDLGAEPPEVSGGAIPMPELIDAYANRLRPDPVDANLNRLGWVVPPIYDWFRGDPRFNYFAHFDLSKSGDQSGFSICHYDYDTNLFVADLIMKIPVSKDWNLKFKSIEILIDFLIERGFYFAMVTFDGFQSLNIIQTLLAKGVNASQYSVDRSPEAYDTLIASIFQRRFDYYYHELFITEVKGIQLKGNKYDHPINGSKDVSDSVAGSLRNCVKSVSNVLFNRADLSELFFIDNSLHDLFHFQDNNVVFKAGTYFSSGRIHSFFINSYDDLLIVLHGYLNGSLFTLDYLETFDTSDPSCFTRVVNLILATNPTFTSLGTETSFSIVDLLRDKRLRVIAPDVNRLDKAALQNIRVVRSNSREMIDVFVSQIKQRNLKLIDKLTLFNQISELNYTNFSDKVLAISVATWLHYMIQETKRSITNVPRPVLGGGISHSSIPDSGPVVNPSVSQMPSYSNRPKTRLR